MPANRFDIMDAQRFDLSKRGRARPSLSIETARVTTRHTPNVKVPVVPPNSPASWVGNDHARIEFSIELSRSSSSSDQHTSSWSSSASFSPPSSPVTSPPSTVAIDDHANPHEIRQIDVIDKGTFTTTRTIICPTSRSPVMSCIFSCPSPLGTFSRPSSPVPHSRPSSPMRPRSPMNINLNSLSCFSSTDAFAVDIDSMLERTAVAQPAIEVMVTKENDTHTDELCEVLRSIDISSGMRRRRGHAPSYAFGIS